MSLRRTFQLALVVVVASVALAFGSAAGAVDNPDYTAPPPSSVVENSVPQTARQISSAAATPSRQRLAITGADSLGLVVVGALLLAGGAATLLVRRRNALA